MKATWPEGALPVGRLPPTIYPAHARLQWFSTDSRESFGRGGHRLFGTDDIEYVFDALGYRTTGYETSDGLRIIAIGCSYVFGIGLPAAALFHSQVCAAIAERLGRSVTAWNLGLPGVSNDYIARMLHIAVPLLDPHLVLVNFTHADRREYVSVQGEIMPYCPGWQPRDPVGRTVKARFEDLASACDDDLNLYRNYKSVESLLSPRLWLYSTIAHPLHRPSASELEWGCLAPFHDHLDRAHFAGTLRPIDQARDGSHPGPASHRALAQSCWNCLSAMGGIERLAAVA